MSTAKNKTASVVELKKRISQALGTQKSDVVIKNAQIFHLTTGEIESGDIAICGEHIVGVGGEYWGETQFDANGLIAVPGFIDAHCHIESSRLAPYEFERCVLPHGTTTAVCDPHELANVAGLAGLEYFAESAKSMRMNLIVRASSCVPATKLETSGGELTTANLDKFFQDNPGTTLAEMMNFPGLLAQDIGVLEKLALGGGADGHAPLLSGKELNAYLSCGVDNDHECSMVMEAREKLRRGMNVFIREGSAAQGLDVLSELLTIENAPFLGFCTDDREPSETAQKGHIDAMIRRAIELGASPLVVYRIASWSAAKILGLKKLGLIAPGYRADIVLVNNLNKCEVKMVFKDGQMVNDRLFESRLKEPDCSRFGDSVKLREIRPEDFVLHCEDENTMVIKAQEGSLITHKQREKLPVIDGIKSLPMNTELAKLAVLERHGKNGNIGLGFVSGFKMSSGALASSVGHDSHNICVVGTSDEDMALAVNLIRRAQGGCAVVKNGVELDFLPLKIGGLMSDQSFETVICQLGKLADAVKLVSGIPQAFQLLSFMALPVIPHLKLTDMGLVDVDKFEVLK